MLQSASSETNSQQTCVRLTSTPAPLLAAVAGLVPARDRVCVKRTPESPDGHALADAPSMSSNSGAGAPSEGVGQREQEVVAWLLRRFAEFPVLAETAVLLRDHSHVVISPSPSRSRFAFALVFFLPRRNSPCLSDLVSLGIEFNAAEGADR